MKLKSTSLPTYDIYALRGEFSGVVYFMAKLPLAECVQHLHIENATEVKSFRERMQRTLDEKRAEEIYQKYLRSHRTRFFNSLVAVMVPPKGETGGYYEFHPFQDDKGKPIPFGLLKVLTSIDRVVVDGQHRLKSLMHAEKYTRTPEYDESYKLKELEIPVVFLAFSDVGGDHFNETYNSIYEQVTNRARKVFVDLNQNAKKADKKTLYILNDGDFSAVVARYKIESDSEFELYTRWHGNGAALVDSDHCRTTIELLNHFAEVLIGEDREELAATNYDLSDENERSLAIDHYFLKAQADLQGLVPNDFIDLFFTRVGYLATWSAEVERRIGKRPKHQPALTELKLAEKKEIRDLRNASLLGTVVGQKVAFEAIHEIHQHMGQNSALDNLSEALRRLDVLNELGLFHRDTPLWLELLVRPGGRIKLTAYEPAKRILSHLLQLIDPSSSSVSALIESYEEDGDATKDTLAAYQDGVERLRAALQFSPA